MSVDGVIRPEQPPFAVGIEGYLEQILFAQVKTNGCEVCNVQSNQLWKSGDHLIRDLAQNLDTLACIDQPQWASSQDRL